MAVLAILINCCCCGHGSVARANNITMAQDPLSILNY